MWNRLVRFLEFEGFAFWTLKGSKQVVEIIQILELLILNVFFFVSATQIYIFFKLAKRSFFPHRVKML